MKDSNLQELVATIEGDAKERLEYDQSGRAEILLNSVLQEGQPAESIEDELTQVAINEAKEARPVLDTDSGRTSSRVLFITQDTSYLEDNSPVLTKLKLQALLFDEVHVLVVAKSPMKDSAKRIIENMWVYVTGASYWWWRPQKAVEFAHEQLVFSDTFRPDIVVSLDPGVSGIVGQKIADHFKRPHQVHVLQDYFSRQAKAADEHPGRTKRLFKKVIKRADSVRVTTDVLFKQVERVRPKADIALLPRFHNFKAIMAAQPAFSLKTKYPQYNFIILTFAAFELDSPLQDIFTAFHSVLQNPKIGLLVIGGGSKKHLYQEKAKLLGIEKNVILDEHCTDLVSCLKSADVFIQTEVTPGSEEAVLQAAAAGLPMILYETELRLDLFEDGKSATLCEPGDVQALEKEVKHFLNNSSLRLQYQQAAQQVITTRLYEDETTYYKAYRDSVETGLTN